MGKVYQIKKLPNWEQLQKIAKGEKSSFVAERVIPQELTKRRFKEAKRSLGWARTSLKRAERDYNKACAELHSELRG